MCQTICLPPQGFGGFSPCQITGFFQIHDSYRDPRRKGSTGASINLEHGVATKVYLQRSQKSRVSVTFNGSILQRPIVSAAVANRYLHTGEETWRVRVLHRSVLPIGCGYGTSGAAAASLSLAMNDALGDPLSKNEAMELAHVVEIECKTGLGTVESVYHGGLLVRVKAGAPGPALVRKLTISRNARVVSGYYGPIPTRRVLTNPEHRARINACGRGLVQRLLRQPDEEMFMLLSHKFSKCVGLLTPRLRRILRVLLSQGVTAGMLMLGDGLFTIVPKDEAPAVSELLAGAGLTTLVSKVSQRGARVI